MHCFINKFNNLIKIWRALTSAIIAGMLIVSGCTTVTVQSFEATRNSNVEASYVATDADFGKYKQLFNEEAGISFPESSPVPEEDLRRIRQIFRDALISELAEYEIVDNSGPTVMTVQASLIDLRDADLGDVPDMRAGLDEVARPGVLVFMMEMRDSETGRVLARAADSTANPKIGTGGVATDWSDMQTAAQHWALLFRQFLDQNLDQ